MVGGLLFERYIPEFRMNALHGFSTLVPFCPFQILGVSLSVSGGGGAVGTALVTGRRYSLCPSHAP